MIILILIFFLFFLEGICESVHKEKEFVATSFFDTKLVHFISNCCSTTPKTIGKHGKEATEVVEIYNLHKGGVDRADKNTLEHFFTHRQVRWTKACFHYLVKGTVANGWIIWKKNNPSTQENSQYHFIDLLCNQILGKHKDFWCSWNSNSPGETNPDYNSLKEMEEELLLDFKEYSRVGCELDGCVECKKDMGNWYDQNNNDLDRSEDLDGEDIDFELLKEFHDDFDGEDEDFLDDFGDRDPSWNYEETNPDYDLEGKDLLLTLN